MTLTEEATTAASRIFMKIVFQDLADELGLATLVERLRDPDLQPYLNNSIFPRDSMANIRFSINFFTAIGLATVADELRTHLQNFKPVKNDPSSSSSSYSSDSSSSDSDSRSELSLSGSE